VMLLLRGVCHHEVRALSRRLVLVDAHPVVRRHSVKQLPELPLELSLAKLARVQEVHRGLKLVAVSDELECQGYFSIP
jgi:hypothetical protein